MEIIANLPSYAPLMAHKESPLAGDQSVGLLGLTPIQGPSQGHCRPEQLYFKPRSQKLGPHHAREDGHVGVFLYNSM